MNEPRDIALFILACIPAAALTAYICVQAHAAYDHKQALRDAQTEFEIYTETVPDMLEEELEKNRYITSANVTFTPAYDPNHSIDMIKDYTIALSLTEEFAIMKPKEQFDTLLFTANKAELAVEQELHGSMPAYCEIMEWYSDVHIMGGRVIKGKTSEHTYRIDRYHDGDTIYIDDKEYVTYISPSTAPTKPQNNSTYSKPSSTAKPYYYYGDAYDADDYDNPDDFADDWAEEFGDGNFEDGWDDAWDYWHDRY